MDRNDMFAKNAPFIIISMLVTLAIILLGISADKINNKPSNFSIKSSYDNDYFTRQSCVMNSGHVMFWADAVESCKIDVYEECKINGGNECAKELKQIWQNARRKNTQ
jgi:hypothetical protein